MFILDSRHKFKGFLPKMENFPVKIVRQTLPRTFCGEKMPGRPCRGLPVAKKRAADTAEGFLGLKNGSADSAEDFLR